ncbi:hypothetical protein DFH09DRAFT_1120195 [Mycena vulgaris]|nr:hypothetical protein DFH09DRAFT_1120195 [Mycena vulgaris]
MSIQEELYPITQLTTVVDVSTAFRDIFHCYRWLYETSRIIHRDISIANLMFRMKNGAICGVLNDYDLAVKLDSSYIKHRTGTGPFMAVDLLVDDPPAHLYRFDLESMFYVLLILTSSYVDGVKVANPPLEAWDRMDLQREKLALLNLNPTAPFPSPTEQFSTFRRWTNAMFLYFSEAYTARLIHILQVRRNKSQMEMGFPPLLIDVFDNDTLGGNVTFDTFAKILDIKLQDSTPAA